MRRKTCWAMAAIPAAAALALGMRAREGSEIGSFTLNAFDHRLAIWDFRREGHGESRQLDDQLREYVGDVLFDGKSLHVLESERYTGLFLDLGEERGPDTEFSLFHGLRLYKRGFQLRQFPFQDRYAVHDGIEPSSFFTNPRDAIRSVEIALGHTYLVRFHNRTTVSDERMYILRVIESTPGVTFTALYRELVSSREP